MSDLAKLTIDQRDGVPVARLAGEVDSSNADALGERLAAAVPNSAMGLVLDLTGTSYLDSAGVNLLFGLAERLRRRQQRLFVVIARDSFVEDLSGTVALESFVTRESSVSAAIDALIGSN